MTGQVTPLTEAVRRWDTAPKKERQKLLERLGYMLDWATVEFDSLPQRVRDAMEQDVAYPTGAT